MMFEDGLHNLNDSRLKPWLLHSIMASHLPDDKQPTRAPIQLSMAVASIRRHHLLSEVSPKPGTMLIQQGGKTMDGRKGAVEAWLDRLLSLLASSVAENRWAGVCLLGVTCQECSRQRFLDSYSTWIQRLLLSLKQPTDPIFVRAAACASITDLLTRLGGLVDCAGVRRDAGPLVGKLVQPVLHILGDKESSGIWNEALELLCALLKHFPSSLRQQFNQTELLLVAKLVDGDCTGSLSQKCAQCLALLPRVYGDVSSWSSLIRRLLIAVNNELDAAFAGLEDPTDTSVYLPGDQEAPWPTICQPLGSNGAPLMLKSFWQQVVPRVSSMLHCCCYLLVSLYPVPVPVPVGPLLNVIMRILHVDGSRVPTAASLGIPISTAQQASLCSELPALHLNALDLLSSTVHSTRSQLLPQAADVVRILSDYSKRNASVPPGVRIKLYGISKQLILMGAGMASALAPAVVTQALGDLRCSSLGSSTFSPKGARTPRVNNVVWTQGGWAGAQSVNHRKRKEPGSFPCDQLNGAGDAVMSSIDGADPISVQTAALQTMEALLTSGGALLPDRWRAEVDTVLANVAVGASVSTMSLAVEEELMFVEGSASGQTVGYQVAAYRALLASLLSPCCHRPPHLAQALAIFRKGRQDGGKEVAEVCAHALLSLEPLIHPRCLPPAGTPAAVVAGMATGRATTGGSLISMQRPGRASVAAGSSVTAVSGAAAILGFPVAVVPPSLKIGQVAMDPWAEVDTWLGYGEEFGEEGNPFYETDVMLEDDFNEGLAGAVGTPVGAFYGTDAQNAQESGVPKLVLKNDEDMLLLRVDSGLIGPDNRKQSLSSGGEFHDVYKAQEEGQVRDIAPTHSLVLEVVQMDGPYVELNPPEASVATHAAFSASEVGVSSVKGDSFLTSRPLPVAQNPEAGVAVIEMQPTPMDADVSGGMSECKGGTRGNAADSGVLELESPPAKRTAFSRSEFRAGSESDSDGPLPDIVDADPDSD